MQTIKPRGRYLRQSDIYAVRDGIHWALGKTLSDALESLKRKRLAHVTGSRSEFKKLEAKRASAQ